MTPPQPISRPLDPQRSDTIVFTEKGTVCGLALAMMMVVALVYVNAEPID